MDKGMIVRVYRPDYDCTNGGQSSAVKQFTVVGVVRTRGGEIESVPKDCRVFTPSEDAPAAILVVGAFKGCTPNLVPLVDYERSREKGNVGPMAGGNKADSSDSRWGDLVRSFLPGVWVSTVDIHDRVETYRDYLALSM